MLLENLEKAAKLEIWSILIVKILRTFRQRGDCDAVDSAVLKAYALKQQYSFGIQLIEFRPIQPSITSPKVSHFKIL